MGIGTIFHIGVAVFDVVTGNYVGAIEQGCACSARGCNGRNSISYYRTY